MERAKVYDLYKAADAAAMLEKSADAIEANKDRLNLMFDQAKDYTSAIENALYWLLRNRKTESLLAIGDLVIQKAREEAGKYNKIIEEA